MLKNYFTIAWRNLWKHKVFSLINVLGLSTGIAFTLLTAAYIWGELQIDNDLKNADNQYVLLSDWKDPNMGFEIGTIAQLPKALKDMYPNLVANFYHWDSVTSNVSKGDKHFRENIQIGDSTLLSMYGLGLSHGDAKTAMNDPFSAIITEATAIKYFGTTDIVGKTINIESFRGSKRDFAIAGILKKMPKNSVLNLNDNNNIDIILPAKAAVFLGRTMDGWNNTSIVGFVELKNGITPKDLEKPIRHLVKENAPKQISDNLTPRLVSLKAYYLQGRVKQMLYTLSFIAFFILMMAVINFINICIGQAGGRMKEMGIRKVLGGMRKQLMWQFLIESILLAMLATVIASVIYVFSRPYFSNILEKDIPGLFSFPVYFLLFPVLFAILVGLVAGIYPALVLSSFKSVDSLKGKLGLVKENVLFRKTLVGFQFATAIIVFIGAINISQQIDLFFSNNLGFNKQYVIYAQLPRDWSKKGVQKMRSVQYEMAQTAGVSRVALSWNIPADAYGGGFPVYRQGADAGKAIISQGFGTDNQYAATYNIPLKAGTFFSAGNPQSDSSKVVINETGSMALGWKDPNNAIGRQLIIAGTNMPFTIVGVTADFHFGSMQSRIQPMTFMNLNISPFYRYFSIRLKPGNIEKNLSALQKTWAKLLPGAPFEYHFMDEAIAGLYKTELQLKKASYMATVLAVIIVLLGVLGLVSLSVQKRTKEIGIRKVLGSSVYAIIKLFLIEFLTIAAIACLLAFPLSYFIMHNWLSGYVYKVTITPYPFILSLALLALATVILVTVQTIKAALRSPVKSLRTE